MTTATLEDVRQYRGKNVLDEQGSKVGTIDDVYYDEQTNVPEWARVNTGWFGLQHNFVPLMGAETVDASTIRINWSAHVVKNTPRLDGDLELSPQEEQELADYYGLQYTEAEHSSGMPESSTVRRPSHLMRLR